MKKREDQRAAFMQQRFGRLRPIEYLGVSPRSVPFWRCVCDCGKAVVVSSKELAKGDTQSCGCLHKELLRSRNKASTDPWMREHKHTYSSYIGARRRATEPTDKDYFRYGAVGIGFHKPWADDFKQFVSDVGKRPAGHTLDRIDTTKGYVPGNVRWATPKQQAINRRSTVWVSLRGERMTLTDAARTLGVTDGALRQHIQKKGSLDGYHPRRAGQIRRKETA
jgi:hypothetical protein